MIFKDRQDTKKGRVRLLSMLCIKKCKKSHSISKTALCSMYKLVFNLTAVIKKININLSTICYCIYNTYIGARWFIMVHEVKVGLLLDDVFLCNNCIA